jgi:hypothetical protein
VDVILTFGGAAQEVYNTLLGNAFPGVDASVIVGKCVAVAV